MVIVWKLDRFSRDRYDSATYNHVLKKNGVKVISATENIADGPEGVLLKSLLEGLPEYYSAELSLKIHRGQMENALKCKNNGDNIPLGLRTGADGVLEIDPVNSLSCRRSLIVASLNERGIRTAKGLTFRIGSLGTLLKNRKYMQNHRFAVK